MTNTVVRNNTAREGSGIWINGDPTTGAKATLSVSRSLIDRNVATTRFGGGLYVARTGVTVALMRTTVADNLAAFRGGWASVVPAPPRTLKA